MNNNAWIVAYTVNNQKHWELVENFETVLMLKDQLIKSGIVNDVIVGEILPAYLENS